MRRLILALSLLASPALAQSDDGHVRCFGDGRPVDAQIFENCNLPPGDVPDKCPAQMPIGAHWWAHVTREHWPDERDRWIMIPDDKITRSINPIGVPILWLYQSRVQCFAPPDGT